MKRTRGNGKVINLDNDRKEKGWDEFIEPRILTGMIISDKILAEVHACWGDGAAVRSPEVAVAAAWVLEHYERYGQAPGTAHMLDVYMEKMRGGIINAAVGELIEVMLERASEDYQAGSFDEAYMLDQARDYLRYRRLEAHEQEIQQLRETGRFDEAEQLNAEYEPPVMAGANDPGTHIILASELAAQQPRRPPLLLRPWLRAGETNIVFGPDGVGKTLLTMLCAYVLGLEDYDSEAAEVGPFQVKQPCGVLYVDGEMGAAALHERLQAFAWLGDQRYELATICAPDYQLATDEMLDLSEVGQQRSLIRWLKAHPEYRVVVLDSLSTLYGLENESDNSEWINKVQPLLKALRGLGVAQLLLHHAGKNGDLRGASAMRAMPANIISLRDVPGKTHGEAHFTVSAERGAGGKQRDPKATFKPFDLRFFEAEAGRVEWATEAAAGNENRLRIIAALVVGDQSQAAVGHRFGVTQSRVAQIKREAVRDGYLTGGGRQTRKGYELVTRFEDEGGGD